MVKEPTGTAAWLMVHYVRLTSERSHLHFSIPDASWCPSMRQLAQQNEEEHGLGRLTAEDQVWLQIRFGACDLGFGEGELLKRKR